MTSSQDPAVIRAEIERTRASLSGNVDALAYEANPKTQVHRQVDKVTGAATSLKERVMGSAHDVTASGQSAVSSAGDAAAAAPGKVRSQTQGNPLAAGMVAFGAGLLVSSLFPASAKEQQAATSLKAQAEPLLEQAKSVAQDAAEQLREPAQEAVAAVQSTASDAAATVKDEGASAAQSVQGEAKSAAGTVKDQRSN